MKLGIPLRMSLSGPVLRREWTVSDLRSPTSFQARGMSLIQDIENLVTPHGKSAVSLARMARICGILEHLPTAILRILIKGGAS